MKTQALQHTQEPSEARPKMRTRRTATKKPLATFSALKLTYKQAFKEMAAQAEAESIEWMEWDSGCWLGNF